MPSSPSLLSLSSSTAFPTNKRSGTSAAVQARQHPASYNSSIGVMNLLAPSGMRQCQSGDVLDHHDSEVIRDGLVIRTAQFDVERETRYDVRIIPNDAYLSSKIHLESEWSFLLAYDDDGTTTCIIGCWRRTAALLEGGSETVRPSPEMMRHRDDGVLPPPPPPPPPVVYSSRSSRHTFSPSPDRPPPIVSCGTSYGGGGAISSKSSPPPK